MTGAALIGALAFAAPAQADGVLFSVNSPPQLADFKPGGPPQTITFTVTDTGTGEPAGTVLTAAMTMTPASDFTISVSGDCTPNGAASCTFSFPPPPIGDPAPKAKITFTVQENANVTDIPQGTSTGYNMNVNITDNPSSGQYKGTGSGQIYGMPKPVVVTGAVYDSGTGKVVPGALVKLIDDTNAVFTMTTGTDGKFSFTSTASRPIVGELALGASKANYKTVPMTLAVGTPTTDLHLNLDPAPVASASPTDTVTPSDIASDPSVASGAGLPTSTTTTAAAASGGSGMKLILISGIVLVLGGGGAIAYMMLWRKKDDVGGVPARGGGDPYPPRGGGRGLERTTVAPSIGDAPTMLHRPVIDEYADPYAAPRGNLGQRPGGPAGPRQGGGYAPQQPAYGQPGYVQPAAPAYSQPGYDQGGYQQQGYGAGQYDQGGYAQPNGYQQGGYQEPAQPPTPRRPAADPYGAYPPAPQAQPGYAADPTTFGAYPGSPAGPAGYQQGAGYQTETGYAPPHNSGYQQGGPTYPPAEQGYGGQPPAGPQQYGNGYQQSAPPAQGGYQQGGYQQGGHHQGQHGGYQQGGYQQQPAQPYADEPYGQPASQGYPPQSGGYRGGYTPADQRGAVDWLDD